MKIYRAFDVYTYLLIGCGKLEGAQSLLRSAKLVNREHNYFSIDEDVISSKFEFYNDYVFFLGKQ
jgi:hypothetical protein